MKFLKLFFVLIPLSGLMSCGTSLTATKNVTHANTNVDLSKKNFVVLGNVSGSSNNWYLFGIGGLISKNLLGEAYRNMERKANLNGTSRVIINVTYDTHLTWILIYSHYKITATGTVIEFIDDDADIDLAMSRNTNISTYSRPATNTNNASFIRESDVRQVENDVVVLSRQTSDFSDTPSQQRSAPTQQNMQMNGWYYSIPPNGIPQKTSVRLTVQRRESGQAYPQYLILSIDGKNQSNPIVANYDINNGLYVFNMDNNKVYFNR